MKKEKQSYPISIRGWDGSTKELVDAIAGMRYDQVQEFLQLLCDRIVADGLKDEAKGRVILSNKLSLTGRALKSAAQYMSEAWDICKPHMRSK